MNAMSAMKEIIVSLAIFLPCLIFVIFVSFVVEFAMPTPMA